MVHEMRAAMLTKPGHFDIREVPLIKIKQDTDVLIQIDYVGLCGSDLHYFRIGRIGDQAVIYPFVIGHECTGTVRGVGHSVIDLKPGDRIVVEPAVSCGQCDQCRAGRFHTCRRLQFLGCPGQLSGAMSEFLVIDQSNCFILPAELPVKEAVFAEPLSIAHYAWQFLSGLDIKTIGILGAGPIGLSILLTVPEQNDIRAMVTDKVDARLQAAQILGAAWIANPDRETLIQKTGFELDAVFECCGQAEALYQALDLLKPGGHLVVVGIPEKGEIHLDLNLLRRKEITIHNVRRQNGCLKKAIEFSVHHRREIDRLITHSFPLHKVQQAFDLTGSYRDGVIKAVIQMHR